MTSNQKDFIYNSLVQGFRLDGRGIVEHRDISASFG